MTTNQTGMDPMIDLTEKTIALLKKASDFAAVAYDNNLTEVEIDGAKVSTISLELQLRTLAAKLERRAQIARTQTLAETGAELPSTGWA
jgi:predicted nucleotidyltransferase